MNVEPRSEAPAVKVYIAGPIAGKKNGNRRAFRTAARMLDMLGYEPVDPHGVDHSHEDECTGDIVPRLPGESEERREGKAHKYGCYMKADILAMLGCEGAVFLNGWQHSRGASVERQVAEICGLKIMEEHELVEGIEP